MNGKVQNKIWKYFLLSVFLLSLNFFHGRSLAQNNSLEIVLTSPSAGETYYAAPSTLCYSTNIKGHVASSLYPYDEIQIVLEIIQADKVVKTLESKPDVYGEFIFPITVNPKGSNGLFTPVEIELNCEDCHYRSVNHYPTGDFTVRVTAMAPDGTSASDERHARVDLSDYASIPVQVVLKGEPGTILTGVPVTASTWLYLWRTRVITGLTDEIGIAELQVESLSLVPTEYEIGVEPSIVDGYLYESTGQVEVILEPGSASGPLMTVEVTRKSGRIAGQLTANGNAVSIDIPIWLVHLPDASVTKIDVNSGSFILPDVAIDKYLITTDANLLAEFGYELRDQQVDLNQTVEKEVEISLHEIRSGRLQTHILDEGRNLLPFAWLTIQETGKIHQTAPGSQRLNIFDLTEKNQTVIASAPGYFSQAAVLRPGSNDVNEINLVINPDTQVLPWGNGSIILPTESGYEVDNQDIQLDRGWIWGEGSGEEPVSIHLPGADIQIIQGKFAVENVPGKTPWFYLLEGTASILSHFSGETITVAQNQMVAMPERRYLTAVDMDTVVTSAFHAFAGRPFDHTWQPGLKAQVRDRLALLGIGTAQLITFITYLLVFLSLIIIPLYWIYSSYRKRRIQNEQC